MEPGEQGDVFKLDVSGTEKDYRNDYLSWVDLPAFDASGQMIGSRPFNIRFHPCDLLRLENVMLSRDPSLEAAQNEEAKKDLAIKERNTAAAPSTATYTAATNAKFAVKQTIQFTFCVGENKKKVLRIKDCQMDIPIKGVPWTILIPRQKIESRLYDLADKFIAREAIKAVFSSVDPTFRLIYLKAVIRADKTIDSFDLELIGDVEVAPKSFEIVCLGFKRTLLHNASDNDAKQTMESKKAATCSKEATDVARKNEWKTQFFCLFDLYNVRLGMTLDLHQEELLLNCGFKLADAQSCHGGKLQVSSIVSTVALKKGFNSALQKVGALDLHESGVAAKVYLKDKSFALSGKNVQNFQVGITGKFPSEDFFYLVYISYNGKLSDIWQSFQAIENIELLPELSSLKLTLILKPKEDKEEKNFARLNQFIKKMKEVISYDSTAVTECVKSTNSAPYAAVSFQATMPQNCVYDFFGLTGKVFSGSLAVTKDGYWLEIQCSSAKLCDESSSRPAAESSSVSPLNMRLVIRLASTSQNLKMIFESTLNLNLPTDFYGTTTHKATFSGILDVMYDKGGFGKQHTISGTLGMTGKNGISWPTPYGLRFLSLRSASIRLSVVLPKPMAEFEVQAAMTLFECEIELRLRFKGAAFPVGAYFRFERSEHSSLRFSCLLKLLGVSSDAAEIIDFLLPGFNHLFFLYLAPNQTMKSIQFPAHSFRDFTETSAGRTPEALSVSRNLNREKKHVTGPCVKFDASINWLGVNTSLWGGYRGAELDFGGELEKPLNILGILTVSSASGEAGPRLHLVVSKEKGIVFQMDAKVSIFYFISVAARVQIDSGRKVFFAKLEVVLFSCIRLEALITFGERDNKRFLEWDLNFSGSTSIKSFVKDVVGRVRGLLQNLARKMDAKINEMKERTESNSGITWLFYKACQAMMQLARAVTNGLIRGVDFVLSSLGGIDDYEKSIEDVTNLDDPHRNPIKEVRAKGSKGQFDFQASSVVSYKLSINNNNADGSFNYDFCHADEASFKKQLTAAMATSYADKISAAADGQTVPRPSLSDLSGVRGAQIRAWAVRAQTAKAVISCAIEKNLIHDVPPGMQIDQTILTEINWPIPSVASVERPVSEAAEEICQLCSITYGYPTPCRQDTRASNCSLS